MILMERMAINEEPQTTSWRARILVVAVAIATALVAALPRVAAESDDIPRAWDGHPDLNGIWQAIGTAHWDLEDHPSGPGHPDLGAIGADPARARRRRGRRDPLPGLGP